MAEKRTSGQEIEEGQHMPSYVQRRSLEEHSARNSYWNLLKALEEQLALEQMSGQAVEDDGMLKIIYIIITQSAEITRTTRRTKRYNPLFFHR